MELKLDLTNIGCTIKLYRNQQGITQEELSLGICTPSYLSRIENSNIVANLEIYELLFQKLNLDFSAKKQEYEIVNAILESFYTDLLLNNKFNESSLEVLKGQNPLFFERNLNLKRELVLCKYLITLRKYDDAKKQLNAISKTIKTANSRNNFLYSNIAILLFYLTNEYQKAFDMIERMEKNDRFFKDGSKFEIACFHFNAALVAIKLYKYQKCIDSCSLALAYFKILYKPSLDFKCHMMLGIAKNRICQFTLAEEHYFICNNILENIEEVRSLENFNLLYSNLGYCKECQGDFKQAIVYYLKAIDYQEDVEIYINLLICHFKIGNFNESIKYLKIIRNWGDTDSKIQHQVEIFSILLTEDHSMKLSELAQLEKSAFKFFEVKKLYVLGGYYARILANYYKDLYMYKESSDYFEKELLFNELKRKRREN
ncbi:helix-turn-helix transcriptional regulator [Solibacillus sp. FSL K6-1523]|uniref:helix-turn-helix transcriptional regulator n=1 Tax=Solibacillus sp. FSL K6-1523 TaxID=2921471 RepID=UPI0030F655CA